MRIIKLEDKAEASGIITEELVKKTGSVLLLLSGGSAIPIEVDVVNGLELGQLTVGQIDERYGNAGHANSNWQQLVQAGLRNDVKKLNVLSNLSFEDTVKHYEQRLNSELEKADSVVGVFGIGRDGHTAGILPGSLAVSDSDMVVGYTGPDFKRISVTPKIVRRLDLAILLAFGEDKKEQLARLVDTTVDISEQPAQMLKRAKKLIIINDQIGG